MLFTLWLRLRHVAVALLALWMTLSPFGQFTSVQAHVAPATTSAIAWSFTDVTREGRNGFTRLVTGQAGPNGSAVVFGDRGGETGLFRIDGDTVTESVINNTDLSITPAALADVPFVFEQVVTEGQDGFTVAYSLDGIDGRMVLGGTRNGETAVWVLEGGVFTPVLPANGVLPGGLGTVSGFGTTRMTANGDVIFHAAVSGGALTAGSYVFLWRNGVVTLAQPSGPEFTHHFDNPNYGQPVSDGRWLVSQRSGVFPTESFHYSFTDGATVTPFVTISDTAVISTTSTGFTGWCTRIDRQLLDANANGVYAYVETSFVNDPCAPINPTRPSNWSIKLGGAVEATLLTGSYTNKVGQGVAGVMPVMQRAILNDANELVVVRQTRNPSATPQNRFEVLVVDQGGTPRLLFDSIAPTESLIHAAFPGLVSYFDEQGRIAAVGQLGGGLGPLALMKGNDFANDVVLKVGDPLFGSTLRTLQPSKSVYQTAGAGENRAFLLNYDLADGTKGIMRVSRPKPRWANAAGGAWGTAGNWSNAAVPLQTDGVTFPLAATFDVQVGARTISDVAVEAGSPAFRSADLTVSNELLVGNGAHLTLPEGKLIATETNIGYLPPASLANPLTATLTLLNAGTRFTSTTLSLGAAAPAHLFIANGAVATTPIATIGDGSPASVVVGGDGSAWQTTSLRVGAGVPADFLIEEGGFAFHTGDVVVGGAGAAPAAPNAFSRVTIGNHTLVGDRVSTWLLDGPLRIGQGMGAFVRVGESGMMVARGDLVVGDGADGGFLVDGGAFDTTKNVIVGNLSAATMRVAFGGQATIQDSLIVGGDEGAQLLVIGSSGDGTLPATLKVQKLCRFGVLAPVEVTIAVHGVVECESAQVGHVLESEAHLTLGNENGPGRLRALGILIGGDNLEGRNGRGFVEMNGGTLEASFIVRVDAGGVVTGTGLISATVGMLNAGVINVEGGIRLNTPICGGCPGFPDPPEQESVAARVVPAQSAAFQPGTLNVNGPLTLTTSSLVRLDVGGALPAQYDRLLVNGHTTLGGELAINFANGFVPAEGQGFNLIGATSTAGAFAKVTVVGLPAGFKFSVSSAGGSVTFTITDDGNPNTSPSKFKTYLPMIDG